MKHRRFIFFSVMIVLLSTIGSILHPADGADLNITLKLPTDSLQLIPEGRYYRVLMDRTATLGEVGKPDLPLSPRNIIIPPGTSIEKLTVIKEHWTRVEGTFRIAPAVEPQTTDDLIGGSKSVGEEDAAVYSASSPYPGWTLRLAGHGYMRGARLARLEMAPLRWTPDTGILEVLSQIEIRAELGSAADIARMPAAPKTDLDRLSEIRFLQRNVANPEQVPLYFPRDSHGGSTKDPIYNPGDPAPVYVIISPDGDMADAAVSLEQWLTRSGRPADVVGLKWINDNYSGLSHAEPDAPEIVRNFIVEAYQVYGIQYVFLVGDYLEMPTRDFRSCYAGTPEFWFMPTDFYYADLDGSHNMDGDNLWFERYEDYPDGYVFYEDVHVGRIPAKNGQMVADYLDKWFAYIFAVENDFQTGILYAGAAITTCSSTVNKFEDLIDPIVNHPPYDVTKLYCDEWPDIPEWVPLTVDNFINYVSQGQGLILHAAHSGYFGMGMGDQLFQNGIYGDDHVEMLTNLDRYGVMYSLGCSVQPWDYDHAIGEDLVMDPGRGLIASCANSDVGWWTTQMYNLRDFAQSAIGDEVIPVSQNMIDAKQTSIWWYNSHGQFYTPWGKCSVNLLGEPSLEIWTALPKGLHIDKYSRRLTSDTWQVTVTVSEAVSPIPAPVEGARVCLSGGNVYMVDETDAQGQVIFMVTGPSARLLDIVADARNFIPEETTVRLMNWYVWLEEIF